MKKIVRWVLIAVVAAAAAAGGIYAGSLPVTTGTARLEPKLAELTFTEKGVCVAESVADVYPLVAGEVVSVNVKEGQRVNEGDVLCVVDGADLQTQLSQGCIHASRGSSSTVAVVT